MTRPIPPYVTRISAMVQGETIVLQGETSPTAVRYHARRISPSMRVTLWRSMVRVQYKPDLTPEEAEKARIRSLNASNRLSKKSEPYIKKCDRKPETGPVEAAEGDFVESVSIPDKDVVYAPEGDYQP